MSVVLSRESPIRLALRMYQATHLINLHNHGLNCFLGFFQIKSLLGYPVEKSDYSTQHLGSENQDIGAKVCTSIVCVNEI